MVSGIDTGYENDWVIMVRFSKKLKMIAFIKPLLLQCDVHVVTRDHHTVEPVPMSRHLASPKACVHVDESTWVP